MQITDTRSNSKPARTDGIDRKRSSTWEKYHVVIQEAYVKVIEKKNGVCPTQVEVQKEIGYISLRVVGEHMRTLRFDPTDHPLRILTDKVLLALCDACCKDRSPAAIKLWMQLFEGFREHSEHDVNIREIPAITFSPVERKN